MDIRDISLSKIRNEGEAKHSLTLSEKKKESKQDHRIAIIGISARIGQNDSTEDFWQSLVKQHSGARAFPKRRQEDVDTCLDAQGVDTKSQDNDKLFLRSSYLNHVDEFDYGFFGIAKSEADYMDPNQRLFMQSAWGALEDAGIASSQIRGTNCGVFVGFSQDFGSGYNQFIQAQQPDAPEISIVGNIKSIIASRIAYQFDLKGPSMLIDTACSSSLVAIYEACKALRHKDCELAIAGGVKIDFMPILAGQIPGIGVRDIKDNLSNQHRCKTFDNSCDGMAIGEGVGAFILKPYTKALEDGDNIHAVILGGAINQDGNSIGITAPNGDAQEALILSAMKDAGIKAEDYSYIEAHGTATRLGDPIEVKGISKALAKQTRKKQFCGIGSVKSNIGHMDNAAGVPGLLKLVLSMKNKTLPATLHFNTPNRAIEFAQSPLYVCDQNQAWQTSELSSSEEVTAGLSSFGLSGTNCHLILQSAWQLENQQAQQETSGPYVLPISAKTHTSFLQLLKGYQKRIQGNPLSLASLCYTAATGRLHHKQRACFVFSDQSSLEKQLAELLQSLQLDKLKALTDEQTLQLQKSGIYLSTTSQSSDYDANALAIENKQQKQVALESLANSYVSGTDINWDSIYQGPYIRRISIPTYPFANTRCWVASTANKYQYKTQFSNVMLNPLLHRRAVKSSDIEIYETHLSVDSHWELADHKVRDAYVLPGTCYIEMFIAALKQNTGLQNTGLQNKGQQNKDKTIKLNKVQFLSPLVSDEKETHVVHLQLSQLDDEIKMEILSAPADKAESDNTQWINHATASATLQTNKQAQDPSDSVATIQSRLETTFHFEKSQDEERGLDIGDRWNLSVEKGWHNSERNEFLVKLSLPSQYRESDTGYIYHPSLLDTAVNAATHLVKSEGLFLPLSYNELNIFKALDLEFYVHLKHLASDSDDIAKFAIELIDENGNVYANIQEYFVKRVPEEEQFSKAEAPVQAFYLTSNSQAPERVNTQNSKFTNPLVILDGQTNTFKQSVLKEWPSATTLHFDASYSLQEWDAFLSEVLSAKANYSNIIYFANVEETSQNIERSAKHIHALMSSVNHIVKEKILTNGKFSFITQNADKENTGLNTINASLLAFMEILQLENPQLSISLANVDSTTNIEQVLSRLGNETESLSIYKNGSVYQETLEHAELTTGVSKDLYQDDHVYLITGGTGALGLELAQHMCRSAKPTLIMLGHSSYPEKSEWKNALTSNETPERIKRSLHKLIELDEKCAALEVHALDIANYADLDKLIKQVRTHYGKINGIIHAAGRAGDGFATNKTADALATVVSPKIAGAWNLHKVTEQDTLDFFVMYSSVATILRAAGQSDYTAGNAYLDALAHVRRAKGLPAVSIGWPAWREVGIAVDYGAVDENEIFAPINTASALNNLDKVLTQADALPPAFVLAQANSKADPEVFNELNIVLSDATQTLFDNQGITAANAGDDEQDGELILLGQSDPDEYDLMVGRVWSRALGNNEFEMNDHFNDLGGNSVLTIQVFRDYEKRHPGVMDMADLFTQTTIAMQAQFFRDALKPKPKKVVKEKNVDQNNELDDLLAKIASGELSAEDAQNLI